MPNNLDRFGRIVRNLYTAVLEQRDKGQSTNPVPSSAELRYTEDVNIKALANLGQKIGQSYPSAWLRLNDQLLDLGARNNIYADSADATRTWRDYKASLWDTGSPTWQATPRVVSATSLVDSRANGAKTFEGLSSVNDNYLISQTALPTPENTTIEFVVKILAAPAGSWTAGGVIDSNRQLGLRLDSDGATIRLKAEPGGLTFGTLVVGTTYHCMFVRDARGTNRGYVNGVQVYSAASGNNTIYGAAPWCIPGGASGLRFTMDEIAIYFTALTDAECLEHYSVFAAADPAADWTYAPIARYYEPVTFSGSNLSWDKSAVNLYNKASYRGSVLDETTMWCVMRIRPTWDYTTGDKTLFQWQNDANNKITLTFAQSTDSWVLSRLNAGAGATVSIVSAHAAYDYITLAFKLSATELALSVNGGAWSTVGNTNIPTITAEFFDLPMAGLTSMLWMATGVGTLDDSVLANLNTNRDPLIKDFGDAIVNGLSFLWHCRDAEHIPMGAWGESVYD